MAPTSEPMSTGEIARALERIERGTAALHDKLDKRPTWEDVNRLEGNRDRQVAALQEDVDALQGSQTWLYRLTIGAVLTAVLGMVLGAGGDVPPLP